MFSARFRLLALLPLLALTLAARADSFDQFTITGDGQSLSVLLPASTLLGTNYNQISWTAPGVFNGTDGNYFILFIFPGSCAVCDNIFSPLPQLGLPDLYTLTSANNTTTINLLPGTYTSYETGPNHTYNGPFTITITPQAATTPEPPALLLLGTGLLGSTLVLAVRRIQ